MEKPIIIFGAQGLGKVALDILQQNDIIVYGLLDDEPTLHRTEINHVPILGSTDDEQYWSLLGAECGACVALEHASRKQLIAKLQAQKQLMPINVLHPSVILAESTALGHGNLVSAGAVIGPDATIGHHCQIHARAILEHDAHLGDNVQIGAGSIVGAGAHLGNDVFVGAGATIVASVTIGKEARIGAGAVVLANVAARATVLGNPAQPITP